MNNKMHVPKEIVKHGKKSDEWLDVSESIDVIEESDEKKENENVSHSDGNDRKEDNEKIKCKKKNKDVGQCSF